MTRVASARSLARLRTLRAKLDQLRDGIASAVEARECLEIVATPEANAAPDYKASIVASKAADIVYSNLFTGVHGNYLRSSIEAAGLDPDHLPEGDLKTMNFGGNNGSKAKAWRDIWGSGQGIGVIDAVESVADRVDRFAREYAAAKARIAG